MCFYVDIIMKVELEYNNLRDFFVLKVVMFVFNDILVEYYDNLIWDVIFLRLR